MNKTTVAQQAKTSSAIPPAQGVLQRKCACGNHTVADGECGECAKKKTGLQRNLMIGASNDSQEQKTDQVMSATVHSSFANTLPSIQHYMGRTGLYNLPASVDRVSISSGRSLEPVLLGNNIAFGTGQLVPESHEAHHLIDHVVQQSDSNQNNKKLESSPTTSNKIIKVPFRDQVHPVATQLNQSGVRFRVPTFDRLKAAYSDKDLKIPEHIIKSRVTQLLERMARDGQLKTKDSVSTIIAKIFPAPGKIDETEFNNAIDVSDRSKIYQSVTDADTKVKSADKPKLKTAMKDAADLVKKVESDATGLTQVFGTKDTIAKTNYQKTRKALKNVEKSMDTHVTTDYNLDDPEVGLGGFADHSTQKMHLLLEVTQVVDPKETKATLIHEASHLANASVDDQVYYGNPGFFELDESKKVANAAHYEELPRREMGTSKFDKKIFTPGKTAGGAAVTREDKIKAAANFYLRQAWDAGVDAHMFIRGVRREYLSGNNKPFNDNKALILEISKLMDLTIHDQVAGKAIVTTLDVTLSESISRSVSLIGDIARVLPFPNQVIVLPSKGLWPNLKFPTDDELRDEIVAKAVTKHNTLLKDAKRDKILLDWLVAHYRILPTV